VEVGSPSGNIAGCNSALDTQHSPQNARIFAVDEDSGCLAPPPSRGSTTALVVQNRVLAQHELQVGRSRAQRRLPLAASRIADGARRAPSQRRLVDFVGHRRGVGRARDELDVAHSAVGVRRATAVRWPCVRRRAQPHRGGGYDAGIAGHARAVFACRRHVTQIQMCVLEELENW